MSEIAQNTPRNEYGKADTMVDEFDAAGEHNETHKIAHVQPDGEETLRRNQNIADAVKGSGNFHLKTHKIFDSLLQLLASPGDVNHGQV